MITIARSRKFGPHPAHPRASAPGERDRRTLDRHRPPRGARPDADRQPSPPRARAGRVRGALQSAPPSPRTAPRSTTQTTPPARNTDQLSPPTPRPTRRTDPRICPGRLTWMTYSAPTRARLTALTCGSPTRRGRPGSPVPRGHLEHGLFSHAPYRSDPHRRRRTRNSARLWCADMSHWTTWVHPGT